MSGHTYSIAVFPFLKTRRAVSIGGLTFRPTDNVDGLPPWQAESVDNGAPGISRSGKGRAADVGMFAGT